MQEDQQIIPTGGSITPPPVPGRVEIVEHGRQFHVHRLTEPELDTLTAGYNSVHANFFTLCLGALIAFSITLLTVELSDRMFGVFVALAGISGLGTLYFGVRAKGEREASAKLIRQIKGERRVGV